MQFFQINPGSAAAMLFVALLVFLAVRRMVLDRKAGIGICGQKCSQCPNAGLCTDQPSGDETECSGTCSECKYASSCRK